MTMVLDGNGTITGLVAGGLPDATVTAADLSGAQTGSAPIYGARAWCVFNGTTAGTNAPTSGGNVTSVTRNSAGNYTVNFTTAMPDAASALVVTGNVFTAALVTMASSFVTFVTPAQTGTNTDGSYISVVIFR
jgi:hypothetical protein